MELKVWLGCLACYNASRLVGEWMDASEANDWRCPVNPAHDEYQCLDDEIEWLSHEIGPTEAVAWAEAVAGVEDHEAEAFVLFAKHEGWRTPDDVDLDDFRERYEGEWESAEAHAYELLDSLGESTDAPAFFMLRFDEIAWDQDYTFDSGHVFRNH